MIVAIVQVCNLAIPYINNLKKNEDYNLGYAYLTLYNAFRYQCIIQAIKKDKAAFESYFKVINYFETNAKDAEDYLYKEYLLELRYYMLLMYEGDDFETKKQEVMNLAREIMNMSDEANRILDILENDQDIV